MEFLIDARSVASVMANVDAIGTAMLRRASQALNAIGEETMTDAKDQTPVQYGVLKNSGHVAQHATPGDLEVVLAFGTEYAVYVHERLDVRHTNGNAKFLERAVNKTASHLAQDIAQAMAHGGG